MDANKQAIRELLNRAIAACLDQKDEQAMSLMREAIENAKIVYGERNTGPVIISVMSEMQKDSQAKCVELWRRVEQEAESR